MSTVTEHPLGTPSWFDLMTTDTEDARRFYGELFGWTFGLVAPETGQYSMCFVNGLRAAGIGPHPTDAPFPPAWNVYFAVESVDTAAEKIAGAGGQVLMGPLDIFEEGRLAFFSDATGAAFGVWQPKRHAGASVVDEPGAMVWCEVNTRDSEKACEFYTKVFDLRAKPMHAANLRYFTLSRGETPEAGILEMTPDWGDLSPHWMVYFAVSNADEFAENAEKAKGSVKVRPFDMPFGRVAVIADPQGAIFSVVEAPNDLARAASA